MEKEKRANSVNRNAATSARIRQDLIAAIASVQDLMALLIRHEQEITALRRAAINAGTEFLGRGKKGSLEVAKAVKATKLINPSSSASLMQALKLYGDACDLLLSSLDVPPAAIDLEPWAQYKNLEYEAHLIAVTFTALSEQAHTAVARNEAVAEGLRTALVAFATR